MKTAFQPGVKVLTKYDQPATISFRLKSYDWRIPGYLGAGFYEVISERGTAGVIHEDDLRLAGSMNELLRLIDRRDKAILANNGFRVMEIEALIGLAGKAVVRKVVEISQDILHQEDLWKTRDFAALEVAGNL
jgi:hypothetical protein